GHGARGGKCEELLTVLRQTADNVSFRDQTQDRVPIAAHDEGADALLLQLPRHREDGRGGRRGGDARPLAFKMDAPFMLRPCDWSRVPCASILRLPSARSNGRSGNVTTATEPPKLLAHVGPLAASGL